MIPVDIKEDLLIIKSMITINWNSGPLSLKRLSEIIRENDWEVAIVTGHGNSRVIRCGNKNDRTSDSIRVYKLSSDQQSVIRI